jgi:DNA-binding protein YbaB
MQAALRAVLAELVSGGLNVILTGCGWVTATVYGAKNIRQMTVDPSLMTTSVPTVASLFVTWIDWSAL